MNKLTKIINNAIDFNDEQLVYFGYVKTYPEVNKTSGEIVFCLPFSSNTDIYYLASPLNSNLFTLPIPGQLVLIFCINNNFYYSGYFQFTKNQGPDFLIEYIDEKKTEITGAKEDYEDIAKKIFPLEKNIPEIEKSAGETFITGNNNNNIILGFDNDGKAKLSIIQNREESSYDLNTAGIHLRTDFNLTDEIDYPNDTDIENNNNNFILLTEDVLNFVSKVGSIILSSNDKIIINAKDIININADKKIKIKTPKVEFETDNVYLGKNAESGGEPLVLGGKLEILLNDIIDNINNTYTHINTLMSTLNEVALKAFSPLLAQLAIQKAQLNSIVKPKVRDIKSQNNKTS